VHSDPAVKRGQPARSYRYNDLAFYLRTATGTRRSYSQLRIALEHYIQHNNKANLDSTILLAQAKASRSRPEAARCSSRDQSPEHGFWKARWGTMALAWAFCGRCHGNRQTSVRGGFAATARTQTFGT